MKKPIFEAKFELTGETRNFCTFIRKTDKSASSDFHPDKIYLGKPYCRDLKGKRIKLSITEVEE